MNQISLTILKFCSYSLLPLWVFFFFCVCVCFVSRSTWQKSNFFSRFWQGRLVWVYAMRIKASPNHLVRNGHIQNMPCSVAGDYRATMQGLLSSNRDGKLYYSFLITWQRQRRPAARTFHNKSPRRVHCVTLPERTQIHSEHFVESK